MRFGLMIDRALLTISRRLQNLSKNKLLSFGEKRIQNSSIALGSVYSELADYLKKEIIQLLDTLANTDLNSMKISILGAKINKFIDIEFNKFTEYLADIRFNRDRKFDDSNLKQIDDIKSAVEIRLLIIKKSISDKRRSFYWDICKIIFGGLVGALITKFIY